MKSLFFFFTFLFFTSFGYSQSGSTWVNGYTKLDGTYVSGHYKTTSDNTNHNNWSTIGKSNPFTAEPGHKAQDYSPKANNYGQGQNIYTGPNGGQYYINSNGNKVYVPKRNGW